MAARRIRVQKAVEDDLCREVFRFIFLYFSCHCFCVDRNQWPYWLPHKDELTAVNAGPPGAEEEPKDAL